MTVVRENGPTGNQEDMRREVNPLPWDAAYSLCLLRAMNLPTSSVAQQVKAKFTDRTPKEMERPDLGKFSSDFHMLAETHAHPYPGTSTAPPTPLLID